ncbi:MAG: hypothetical protein JJE21_03040 [Spirochaetaceae bacterium]|nr:hypothetical protein [Spirochaetaceae bacterium]
MNKSIENNIWYCIGGFEHLINLSNTHDSETKKIINDKLIKQITEAIDAFGFSNKEIESKRCVFDLMTNNQEVFDLNNDIDLKKLDFITNLYNKKGLMGISDLTSELSSIIEDKQLKDPKVFHDVLFKISSLQYVELVDKLDLFPVFVLYSTAMFLYANIIDWDKSLFHEIDELKGTFYKLIHNTLYSLYINNEFVDPLIFLLRQYEILDLFIIFETTEHLFPNEMIKFILDKVSEAQYEEDRNENKYHCLIMFLLSLLNPLAEQYMDLYLKYFNINIDSAYLKMAAFAAYNNKYSRFKIIMKNINSDELDQAEYEIYDDLLEILEKNDRKSVFNYKVKDKILELIYEGDNKVVLSYLDKSFSDNYLSKFALYEVIKSLLNRKSYNEIETEFILAIAPINLTNYLSKNSIYIEEDDIPSLYTFSVLLIKLNLLSESLMLTTKLLEKVLTLNGVNSMVISNLKLQIKTLKLFLEYKY